MALTLQYAECPENMSMEMWGWPGRQRWGRQGRQGRQGSNIASVGVKFTPTKYILYKVIQVSVYKV